DVKYALERDFLASVGNGYATAYFGDIIGNQDFASGKAKDVQGTGTTDRYTIVLRLKRSTGTVAAQALSLPGSAPVPKEYAAKYDKAKVSKYGQYVVATGPYMVKNDPKSGKITGYEPGKRIELVRNPNWDKSTDFRPAYLDKIVIDEGNDATVGSRKILSGQSTINNPADLPPPPQILKQYS